MKFKWFALPLMAIALMFVSCEKDDDGDNDGGVTPETVGRLVKGIKCGDRVTWTFEYDAKGRLTTYKNVYTDCYDEVMNLSYSDGVIMLKHTSYDSNESSTGTGKITLNDKNLLSTGVINYDGEDREEKIAWTYTYNVDGSVASIKDDNSITDLTWKSGNLVGMVENHTYDDHSNVNTEECVYGTTENNTSIDLNGFVCGRRSFYKLQGFNGMRSKYMAKIRNLSYDGTYDEKYTYTYEYDSKGYIVKVKEVESGHENYPDIYTIEYYD